MFFSHKLSDSYDCGTDESPVLKRGCSWNFAWQSNKNIRRQILKGLSAKREFFKSICGKENALISQSSIAINSCIPGLIMHKAQTWEIAPFKKKKKKRIPMFLDKSTFLYPAMFCWNAWLSKNVIQLSYTLSRHYF